LACMDLRCFITYISDNLSEVDYSYANAKSLQRIHFTR
jgi:hypothetical protein